MVEISNLLIKDIRTGFNPVPGICKFFFIVRPPLIDEFTMIRILEFNHVIHGIPDFPCTFLVEEVTHINGTAVDKHIEKLLVFHQSAEQTGVLI